MSPQDVHHLLRSRKSVYPPQYIDKEIDEGVLKELLETANWAPTHRLTEPWRFKVFAGNARKKLGEFMAESYRKTVNQDEFSVARYEKLKTNPIKAGCVLAVCMQRDPEERVPEWEEIASVAMAVQNIWISASAYGIGGYWSTPKVIEKMSDHVTMNTGEKCIGLFYMGYFKEAPINRKRSPIDQKLTWLD